MLSVHGQPPCLLYALKVAAPPAVGVVRLSGAAVTAVDDYGDCLLVAGTPVRDLLDHANVLSIAAFGRWVPRASRRVRNRAVIRIPAY
jgi:hypothetical protein